jgi:hypothetical protein
MTEGRVVMVPAPLIRKALIRYRKIIELLHDAQDSDDYEKILCGIDKRTCSLAEIALNEWEKACAKEVGGTQYLEVCKMVEELWGLLATVERENQPEWMDQTKKTLANVEKRYEAIREQEQL